MVKGAKGKKGAAAVASKNLDLALPVTDDLDIVHNKRDLKAAYGLTGADDSDDDHIAVLPGEAHDESDDDKFETFDDFKDVAQMAKAASKKQRRGLDDDDFGIAGIAEPDEDDAAAVGPSSSAAAAPTLEEVERDFAKLSSSERLAMLKKESPEVLTLLQELRSHISDAAVVGESLAQARIAAKKGSREHELVDFLETKVTLLLTYCAHVTFYLLLKAEGKKISGHPVVDRLVEIRTYIEKLRPVEQRLSYSLNKLLSGQGSAAPKVSALRPVAEYGGEIFQANKSRNVEDDKAKLRKARARLEQQKELEREEEAAMTRVQRKAIMKDGDLELLQAADPGVEEQTDHFLSGMVGGFDSDEEGASDNGEAGATATGGGKSLIDKLRAKVSTAAKEKLAAHKSKPKKPAAPAEGAEDGDMEDGEEDDEGADYDALLAEEYARSADAAERRASRPEYTEAESARREVNKKILSHRGLTKARPKDQKNPRVARKEKYSKGKKNASAQSRGKGAERPDKFVGVAQIKTNITHTTRLS